MSARISAVVVLACLALPPNAFAHEGLHEQIAEATRLIDASPRDATLYLKRADLQRLHGVPELALLDVDRAAALDTNADGIDFVRGKTLLDLGKPQDAAAALTRHLTRRPDDAEALFARATARTRFGSFASADADFAGAIAKLAQPKPEHYAAHARAVAAMGGEHVARALAILDAGQTRLGVNAALEVPAIDYEIALSRWSNALARIDALASQSERKEYWLSRRGDVLKLAGRSSEAREAWNSALLAIDKLPHKPRHTRAVLDLEDALRTKLRGE